ncbi:hypothetical protein EXS74_01430 [Candidatus Woesearchaeota archaeon]|nr:hypothetical protein [Candidatus Woesearchaeota archaeon]
MAQKNWRRSRIIGSLVVLPSLLYGLVNKDRIEDKIARYFPEENISIGIEPILNARNFVPEEFYIKLFHSDGFIPVSQGERYNPFTCTESERRFTQLDGSYHDTDIYTFALQGMSSGHLPKNRRKKVGDNHDDSVTWLDAVKNLTSLSPEKAEDQQVIRLWIEENYKRIFHDGRALEPDHLSFKMEGGMVVDILYDGFHKDEQYEVSEFFSGHYRSNDNAWIPETEKKTKHKVTDRKGHLTLPAPSQLEQMLLVPDYILRDDIDVVNAAVYTGRGYSKYGIRIEEIIAELNLLAANRRKLNTWGTHDYSQVILTPTLDLVVSEITEGKRTEKEKKEAIIKTLSKEPYSDTEQNTSPLVTLVAGGQCGATSGQVAAMFHLAGIKEFSFVHFPQANHIGVYGPLHSGLPLSPKFGEYDQYWYIETTSGRTGVIGEFMPQYGTTLFDAVVPQAYDLRPQLQHLKAAQKVSERRKK